jgi:signal transduction histidine kinase
MRMRHREHSARGAQHRFSGRRKEGRCSAGSAALTSRWYAPEIMFTHLSLRPCDAESAIRTEIKMLAKGVTNRLVFAFVMSATALLWLPALAPCAYFAWALIWELGGSPWLAKRAPALARTHRAQLRWFYRATVLIGACYYAAMPLSGLIAHQLIGWYAAIISFSWATIVGVTYFSNDRWLFGASALPSFAVASLAPLMFNVRPEIGVAVFLLHALFVAGALQSAVHRAELVESIAKEEAARSKAETANVEKSEFIANVSHELRAPLNAIIGYTEMLKESAEEEARVEDGADLERVLGASRKLLALVNEFLDISKIEAGRLALNVGWYDIDDLLAEAVAAARPQVEAGGNQFAVDPAGKLGQGVSDEYRLSQCLQHLLSNAARVSQNGIVSLQARRETASGGEWLVIEVRDGDVDASAERVERLLDPFAQSERGASPEYGAGLGLAITRRIARLLGGDLTVASRAGHGSTFTMRTPLVVRAAGARETKTAPLSLPRVA